MKEITKKRLFALLTSFFMSNTITVSGSLPTKEKYGFISVFFSFFAFVLLLKIYDFIFKKSNAKDFYQLLEKSFSKKFYNIILFLIFVYSLSATVMSSLNVMFFITVSSRGKINLIFAGIILCLCLFSIITKDKKVLSRYCSLSIFGIFFLFFVMIVFGLPKGDFTNLSLSFSHFVPEFAKSFFQNFLSPFSDIFFMYLFLYNLCDSKKISKYAKISGLSAAVILSGVYVVNLCVLGKELMSEIYYPTLFSFGIINPVNKISRSEIIYYSSHLFFDIIYIAVMLFVCKDCFFKLFFKKENKKSKTKEYVFCVSAVSFILLYISISNFSGNFYNVYEKFSLIRIPANIGLILILFFKYCHKKNQSKFISEKLM